jgi:GntR family transcriptional repressor for pyruvate dehydrogenase complex
MRLRVIAHLSLADQAAKQLIEQILTGHYPPGMALPPERALAHIFRVNRHVIREALQRLEQLGLLRISREGGAQVLDFRRSAGLDLLAVMAEHAQGGHEFARYWRSVLEMRAATGADVVRLCALNAGPDVKRDLVSIATEMDATSDGQRLFALEVRFWERILDGADNIAYRLAFNSLLKGVLAIGSIGQYWSIEEIRQSSRVSLATAIASGDAAKAEADTRRMLRKTSQDFAERAGLSEPVVKLAGRSVAKSGGAGAKPKARRKT